MFIYTENDTGYDKHINNNNLWYKTHQQYTNTFLEIKIQTVRFLLYVKVPYMAARRIRITKILSTFQRCSRETTSKQTANRRQTGGSSSGSSSGVPTGPVGGAPAWPARRAAAVCCSMIIYIYMYINVYIYIYIYNIYTYIYIYLYIYIWFFNIFDFSKICNNMFLNMIIYTENDTESHKSMQNINL